MPKNVEKHRINFDFYIFAISVGLALFGLLMIYSASSYTAELRFGDAFYYVKKQATAFIAGVPLCVLCAFIPLDKLKKFSGIILGVSIVLLALVFIPGFGVESYGATRWINLGFFTIQPSEFSKFGLVIFIAAYMSGREMNTFVKTLPPVLAGGVVCLLIMFEPNMSVTVCVAAVTALMLFFGGIRGKHAAGYALPVFAAVPALIIAEPYRIKRITAFLDPWSSPKGEGYQLIQSFYALASGGLFGVGIGNSRQKYLFLPFAESDFILSVICEETGLFGCLIVVAAFVFLITRGIICAVRAKDRFACYLGAGISVMFGVQTIVNIAVVSGAIPPTGLPMPFISAGGTSLIAYMCAAGLLVNVSRNGNHTQNFLKPT
ncbi:MAG: putative lipid II flippase FtsW [Clostridiaceae bacterium]|jgi:cell division protein FtsW|nr:putative lipid II flippase FtsW [Clostridiaceae bacterium]